jgi:LacI family transcriptional regulator
LCLFLVDKRKKICNNEIITGIVTGNDTGTLSQKEAQMTRSRKSITIHDVALAAGVSASTVSRVLNDKDDVSLETFQRVQKVIGELGYTSSLAARGMRSRQTNVIGLVMPDVASPYSVAVMQGVNDAIAKLDYDLLVYTNGDFHKYGTAVQEQHYVALLNGGITDGVIVVTPVATIFSTDAPVVAIDPNNESPECPAIISTNYDGALQALNHLLDLGHKRIGHITGRRDLVSANRRIKGYRDALEAAGIPIDDDLIQCGDYTSETAEKCTQYMLKMKNPPTAIFAANDMSAMGVYRAVHGAGLRIPDDISVVGFDNLRDVIFLDPPLTTVNQYVTDMGRIAVEMIVKLIGGEPLENNLHKVQTRLVIRASTRSLV